MNEKELMEKRIPEEPAGWPVAWFGNGSSAKIIDQYTEKADDGRERLFLKLLNSKNFILKNNITKEEINAGQTIGRVWEEDTTWLSEDPAWRILMVRTDYKGRETPMCKWHKELFDQIQFFKKMEDAKEKQIARLNEEIRILSEGETISDAISSRIMDGIRDMVTQMLAKKGFVDKDRE